MLTEAVKFKKDWQAAQKVRLDNGVEQDSYVYVHLREDDDTPFYVGIGYTHTRPWEKNSREDIHKNFRKAHGMRVYIVATALTWEQACFWERRWIHALREDGYKLANISPGGESVRGLKWTDAQREEHRIRLNSPKTKAKRDATNNSLAMKELRAKNTAETWTDSEIREKRIAGLTAALNSEEYKIKRAETDAKPEVIARRSASNKEAQNRPETKAKKRLSAIEAHQRPETKALIKLVNNDPVVKAKRSSAKTGEKHHLNKLNEVDAIEIIKSTKSGSELAKMYNVTPATICDIRAGRSWVHLPRPEINLQELANNKKNAVSKGASKGWETRRKNQLLKKGVE